MSEQTLKLPGYRHRGRPPENAGMIFHRQLINQIVYSIYQRKKDILQSWNMPPQPVSLEEIWKEYESRYTQLKKMRLWKHRHHMKRWVDRRVNECACPTYYDNGVPKIVATVEDGYYQPNPNPEAGELKHVGLGSDSKENKMLCLWT